MNTINEKIKESLKNSGISQTELAKKLGISRQHLHDILKENRKSKYLQDIAKLLYIPKFEDPLFEEKAGIHQTKLPILTLDDLIHFAEGHYSTNQLYKPFYKEWPFYEPGTTQSHFCFRLPQEFASALHAYPLGAFRFYLPFDLKSGSIVMAYLSQHKKMVIGKLEINSDTGHRYLVSDSRIDLVEKNTWLMAECTQLINLFE